MSDKTNGRCIYCCEVRPPSREHVLQRSLGGDLTTIGSADGETPIVCKECNQGFSSIDQALAERSLIALSRVIYTKRPVQPADMVVQLGGEHFHYDPDVDLWLDVHILNGMLPHVPPQLHIQRGSFRYRGSDLQEKDIFVSLINKRRKAGTILETFVKVGPSGRCSLPRLVQHRRNDLFMRAESQEAGQQALALLDAKWTEIESQLQQNTPKRSIAEKPNVEFHLSFCFDDVHRAIAKSAFNYLAIRRGAEFALRPEFDEIRAYIRGLSVVHPESLQVGEVAVDSRYVHWQRNEKPILPTKAHAIGLLYMRPALLGLVTLYGEWSFIIWLGNVDIQKTADIEAHEFSIDRTGHVTLGLEELVRRARVQDQSG